MKTLMLAAALALAGCAGVPLQPITPSTVNPTATDATNALICLIKARGGDCSAPCPAPPLTTVSYLDRNTATLNDDLTALQTVGTMQLQQPVVAAVAGIQATLCTQAGKVIGAPPSVTTAPAPTPVPAPAKAKP